MSGRLCCSKQQQHSKLLAEFVLRVSAFHFNTRTKMHVPLPYCRVNNTLIQFVPSCQDTRMQFIDILDPPFSDITSISIICVRLRVKLRELLKIHEHMNTAEVNFHQEILIHSAVFRA